MKPEQTTERYAYPALLLIVGLFLVGNLSHIKVLWGLNFYAFLDGPWTLLCGLLVLLLAVPAVSSRVSGALAAASSTLNRKSSSRYSLLAVVGLGLGGLFILMSARSMLLGDAILRSNHILRGQFWLWTEAGDFLLHAILYQSIFGPMDMRVADVYRWVSVFSGVVYVFGAAYLARSISSRNWLSVFLCLLGSGVLVLFFGYVESYSLIAAFLPVAVAVALKTVEGRLSPIWLVVVWLVCGVIHVAGLLLLGGALILVLSGSHRRERLPVIFRPAGLLVVSALLVVVLYIVRMSGLDGASLYILPWLREGDPGQAILTVDHVLNLANWLLLAITPGIVAAAAAAGRGPDGNERVDGRSRLAVALALPSLFLLLFFTPQLGGPRDWDLFAVIAYPLLPAALIRLISSGREKLPAVLLPSAVMGMVLVMGFAAVNQSSERALIRHVEIIEVARFKNLFLEYANLFSHASNDHDLARYRLQFAQKAWAEPPYTHHDSVAALQMLTDAYMQRGNAAQSAKYIALALRLDSTDFPTHMMAANHASRFGGEEETRRVAELFERHFPDDAHGQMNAGINYMRAGSREAGARCLMNAYRLDSNEVKVIDALGTYQLEEGNAAQAQYLFNRARRLDPEDFMAVYHLSVVHQLKGDIDSARVYLRRSEPLVGEPQQQDLVNRQWRALSGR